MKISTILHRAADELLAANFDDYCRGKTRYSCVAIEDVLIDLFGNYESVRFENWKNKIEQGLREMGCDVDSGTLFKDYGDCGNLNPDVQGMRYFWLKWAALMAEEQGQ
jgi:hypothetical protein